MVKIISYINTKESDTVSKKLEQEIIKMLQENTGSHFLDSGGAYGRHWERNQKLPSDVEFWDSAETVHLNVWGGKNPKIYGTIFLYHHLKNSLIWDEEVEELNEIWDAYDRMFPDKTWNELMQEFISICQNSGVRKDSKYRYYDFGHDVSGGYTYNHENSLSQDFVYDCFGDWVFIQIHNGCDARGGFTRPKLFKYNGYSLFDVEDYTIGCENGHYWDMDGYNNYYTETDFDFSKSEFLDYDNLDEEIQAQWDKYGYLLDEEEKIFATEGQIILPGVDARLRKPPVKSQVLVIKDKEAFCPICGSKLFADKYWSS